MSNEQVIKPSGTLILPGVALIILGILAMLAPLIAGVSIAILVGIMLMAGGLSQIFFAFKATSFGSGLLAFLIGAVAIICGLLMVAHPLLGLDFLTLLLIVYFIVGGIIEILYALRLRGSGGWGWLLLSGIISLILGALIWSDWPFSDAWAVGILVGVKLLFVGVALISLGFAAKGTEQAQANG